MTSTKNLLAATALALLTAAGAAGAAPLHRGPVGHPGPAARHEVIRHDLRRPLVVRARVFETLRLRHYRGLGDPYFNQGRYVIRTHDRFGRLVLVQIDPHTGAFIREIRI